MREFNGYGKQLYKFRSMKRLEYMQTFNKNVEETEKWEKETKGCAIYGENGESLIELSREYSYDTEYFESHKDCLDERFGIPEIGLAVYDIENDHEMHTSFCDTSEIRKLRDYLTEALNDFFPKEAGHEDEVLSISRDELEALKAKAHKWDVISHTGITANLSEMVKNMEVALVESSSLNRVIMNISSSEDIDVQDTTDIQCAANRLTNITHDVYYNKEDLKQILE